MLPVAPKAQIEEWIRTIGSSPVETANPETTWQFEIDFPARTEHRMVVASPQAVPAATLIITGIQISPEHLQTFANLEDDEKEAFLWDLRQKGISPDVEFQFVGVTSPLDCPSQIQFTVTRFTDGLTMDSFVRSLGAAYKTELAVTWLVQQRLGGGEVGPGRRFDFRKLGL